MMSGEGMKKHSAQHRSFIVNLAVVFCNAVMIIWNFCIEVGTFQIIDLGKH